MKTRITNFESFINEAQLTPQSVNIRTIKFPVLKDFISKHLNQDTFYKTKNRQSQEFIANKILKELCDNDWKKFWIWRDKETIDKLVVHGGYVISAYDTPWGPLVSTSEQDSRGGFNTTYYFTDLSILE